MYQPKPELLYFILSKHVHTNRDNTSSTWYVSNVHEHVQHWHFNVYHLQK